MQVSILAVGVPKQCQDEAHQILGLKIAGVGNTCLIPLGFLKGEEEGN